MRLVQKRRRMFSNLLSMVGKVVMVWPKFCLTFTFIVAGGVRCVTFRLFYRGFSKEGKNVCSDRQLKPCGTQAKNPCKKKKKIKCYCLRRDDSSGEKCCSRQCDDAQPECHYCKKYEVKEDPTPKRKTKRE